MRIIFFIVIFLLGGAFFIISENELSLRDSENFQNFEDLYFLWFGGVFDNLSSITGQVVSLDWVSNDESSNETK